MKRRDGQGQESEAARAAPRKTGPRQRGLENYLTHHLRALFASLGQLVRTPLATLMIAAVIGIALALPAGFHALLASVQTVAAGWEGDMAQISLFLKPTIKEDQAAALAKRLRGMREVTAVRYISPQQALAEFELSSGLRDALAYLNENPLPAVLVVRPAEQYSTPSAARDLLHRLEAMTEVDSAQLDLAWLERLHAMVGLAVRGVWLLAGVLAVGVLLVVGNTIRLGIQNRREEIVVIKLLGATDGFIRRPFVYGGMWYGLFGGVIALLVVNGLLLSLAGPAQQLAALYHSGFRLELLGGLACVIVLGAGAALGWLGAWLAVSRHLRDVEPV
ncbi:MAG: permease-like cell division protein FtsX [Pseudomonadota bacterium]